jgi:hypothetical protein
MSSKGWKPGDAIYDHPTPLDEKGTLKRLLDSLKILDHNNEVCFVVLAVPTSPDISDEVEKRVKDIVSSVPFDGDIKVVGPSKIQRIKEFLEDDGKQVFADLVSIRGYSQIRNLCLLIPAMMNADVAILIDDDEVFEDPGFLMKALEHMNHPIEGTLNYGIAGYYLQPDGGYLVKEPDFPWTKQWDKNKNMNKAFKSFIGSGARLKKTPFVFGGNMVIPKELFSKLPFDPHVPRGEDIDYLMNARMFGFSFYLDNTLSIKHLPPPKSHPTWKRLREDIYRFIYERQKIRDQRQNPNMVMISAEEFDPYPGCFLKDDLEEKINKSNQ